MAHAVLLDMLSGAVTSGKLTILTRHVPVAAEREGRSGGVGDVPRSESS